MQRGDSNKFNLKDKQLRVVIVIKHIMKFKAEVKLAAYNTEHRRSSSQPEAKHQNNESNGKR